jgi:hypothetical protein
MATYNGFTDSQINCMRIGDLLPNIIMGTQHGTKLPMAFLDWLTTSNSYYVKKLLTDEARKYAEIKLQFECNYANADCDWRADVNAFIIDYVPARLWWDYACEVAGRLRKEAAQAA